MELCEGWIAVGWIFVEAAAQDPVDAPGSVAGDLRHRLGLFMENRIQRAADRLLAKGSLARGHVVEQRAERKDVRAGVDGLALDLLRREILHFLPGRIVRGEGLQAVQRLDQAGAAEIDQPYAPFGVYHDAGGSQPSMHDAHRLRGRERVGNLDGEAGRLTAAQPPALHHHGQGLTFGQFHGHKMNAIEFGNLVDEGDIGVLQRGDRHRVLLEQTQPLGIGGDGGIE